VAEVRVASEAGPDSRFIIYRHLNKRHRIDLKQGTSSQAATPELPSHSIDEVVKGVRFAQHASGWSQIRRGLLVLDELAFDGGPRFHVVLNEKKAPARRWEASVSVVRPKRKAGVLPTSPQGVHKGAQTGDFESWEECLRHALEALWALVRRSRVRFELAIVEGTCAAFARPRSQDLPLNPNEIGHRARLAPFLGRFSGDLRRKGWELLPAMGPNWYSLRWTATVSEKGKPIKNLPKRR
jgi:hypothetical protein